MPRCSAGLVSDSGILTQSTNGPFQGNNRYGLITAGSCILGFGLQQGELCVKHLQLRAGPRPIAGINILEPEPRLADGAFSRPQPLTCGVDVHPGTLDLVLDGAVELIGLQQNASPCFACLGNACVRSQPVKQGLLQRQAC